MSGNFPATPASIVRTKVTGTTVGTKHGQDVNLVGVGGSIIAGNEAIAWDSTSTANTTYVGYAAIGSATASAVWRMMKVDTSTSRVTWADGNDSYDNIWDNRTGLTYT